MGPGLCGAEQARRVKAVEHELETLAALTAMALEAVVLAPVLRDAEKLQNLEVEVHEHRVARQEGRVRRHVR